MTSTLSFETMYTMEDKQGNNTNVNINIEAFQQNKIVTYFWPNDLIISDRDCKYVVLGYKVNKKKIVITDIIGTEDYKNLHYSTSNKSLLRQLTVIGCVNSKSKKWNRNFEYDFDSQKLVLLKGENVIYFKPPVSSHLEYYSLDPITINIFWTLEGGKEYDFYSTEDSKYSDKLRLHFPGSDQDADMKEVLRLMNLTNYTKSLLRQSQLTSWDKMTQNVTQFLDNVMYFLFIIYNFSVVRFCTFLNNALTYPIAAFPLSQSKDKTKKVCSLSLMSYTFHQLNFRVKQFKSLPNQFQKLKISKFESEARIIKGTKFNPSEYIKFYNNIWLIVNDTLIGLIFHNFIKVHFQSITTTVKMLVPIYESACKQTVDWLTNSPAGFKLNTELANFFGQMIYWVLEFWKQNALTPFVNNLPTILTVLLVVSRYGGMSMAIGLILDLFRLLFFNIHGFYISCTRIYSWQLNISFSLFRLFYGKKYNVLKNRVDSNDYEFDQLMVGIILFTVMLYLLPTVFAFYLAFSIARLVAMVFTSLLKLTLICLNHLPLVVLLLKLKNEERLPAGVVLEYGDRNQFSIKSKSLTLREIYKSHMNSLMNFNLSNLNSSLHKNDCSDVVENWSRIQPWVVLRKIVLGSVIEDYDYKKMF